MAFEPVYTKTVIASTITPAGGVLATPPAGFTWIATDVDVTIASGTEANHLTFIADFQQWIYWSQPHGMIRQWQWRGRRAILEAIDVVLGGSALGQATISLTVYELSTS